MLEVRGLLGGLKARYAARRVPRRVVEAAFSAWQESSRLHDRGFLMVTWSPDPLGFGRSPGIWPLIAVNASPGGGSAVAAPGTVVGGGRTRGVGRTGSIHPPHDLGVGGRTQILTRTGRVRDSRGRIYLQGRRIWGIRHHLEVREALLTMSRWWWRGVGEEPLPVREGA
jgi:hypothetical protein